MAWHTELSFKTFPILYKHFSKDDHRIPHASFPPPLQPPQLQLKPDELSVGHVFKDPSFNQLLLVVCIYANVCETTVLEDYT